MKLIRMTKTMAGTNGVRAAGGRPFTVSDEEAAQLVAANAAEIVATITAQTETDVLTPDRSGAETAALAGPPEAAVPVKPVKKTKKA